jgi:hypothetical protein
MSIIELGALGEFFGVFALLATLIYVAIQVRQARHESERAVLQASYTGVRELSLSVAASQGLSAALVKAEEAVGEAPRAFEAELIARGLDRQEAYRVYWWYLAQWRHDKAQYESGNQEQQTDQVGRLRAVYSSGVGRLFWDDFARFQNDLFSQHVNQLIAEPEAKQ